MKRPPRFSRRQRGISLIEVLITLFVLLVGLLGVAALSLASQRASMESLQRHQALMLLNDMVSRINANRTVADCYAISAVGGGKGYVVMAVGKAGEKAIRDKLRIRIGGITIAAGAIMAACGDPASSAGEVGRVGTGATNPTLPEAKVDNSVLLRTSASIEQSIVAAYQHILDSGLLAQASATFPDLGDQSGLVTTCQEAHRKAAETYNGLAQEAGGEAWDCGNPRLDAAFLDVIFARVEKGAEATDTAAEIGRAHV